MRAPWAAAAAALSTSAASDARQSRTDALAVRDRFVRSTLDVSTHAQASLEVDLMPSVGMQALNGSEPVGSEEVHASTVPAGAW